MSPAKSQAQQRSAALALSAKRGQTPVSKLTGSALNMYKHMTEKQLSDFAKGSGNMPERVRRK